MKFKWIYIAAPFFNEEQKEKVDNVVRVTRYVYEYKKIYLPEMDSTYIITDSEKTFEDNLTGIEKSDLVIACIDDNDPGTIFEIGYAYSKGIDVILYSERLDPEVDRLNLMLVKGAIGYCRGTEELLKALCAYQKNVCIKAEDEASIALNTFSLI
jgi:nucleoside 2-deoxyribosyltransferase